VHVNWLSITALQAGLALADMLLQSEVFVNILVGTSNLKPDLPTYIKIEEAI